MLWIYMLALSVDETAEISAIYQKYGILVFRKARRILRNVDDTEEVMQEVFYKAMKNLSSLQNRQYIGTWLFRTTITTAIDHLRKRKNLTQIPDSLEAPILPAEKRALASQLLERLPQKLSTVMALYYLEEMTQEEIAEMLEVSRKTVQKRLEKISRAFQEA